MYLPLIAISQISGSNGPQYHNHSFPLLTAPMNHVKYLRAGPAEMPFRNWYTANTNHFKLTDSVSWK